MNLRTAAKRVSGEQKVIGWREVSMASLEAETTPKNEYELALL